VKIAIVVAIVLVKIAGSLIATIVKIATPYLSAFDHYLSL
jgi:hypothetical protein